MRTRMTVALALGLVCLAGPPAVAQLQTVEEGARWLRRHTTGAVDPAVGSSDLAWFFDCVVMVSPESRDYPSRRLRMARATAIAPQAGDDDLVVVTFEGQQPGGPLVVRSLPGHRARVMEVMREYAGLCGARLGASGS